MITGAQIRQGRELLGWRQAELATKAKVETHFVESAESSGDTVSFVPIAYLDAMRGLSRMPASSSRSGGSPARS
jgi:ribosome-binding protein aMBF1 (putative translation factor)